MIWGVTGSLVVDWVVSVDGIYPVTSGGEGGAVDGDVCTISDGVNGVSDIEDHDGILM